MIPILTNDCHTTFQKCYEMQQTIWIKNSALSYLLFTLKNMSYLKMDNRSTYSSYYLYTEFSLLKEDKYN